MLEPIKSVSKRRKRYTLSIDQSDNESWLKFAVKSNSYSKHVMINLALFILSNCLAMFLIKSKLPLKPRVKIAAAAAAFCFSLLIIRKPPNESLTVFRNYGLQITTVKGLILFPESWNNRWLVQSEFIPRDEIVDVVINEGFCRGFQVIFYLAVIIRESTKLKLLFSVCSPKFR